MFADARTYAPAPLLLASRGRAFRQQYSIDNSVGAREWFETVSGEDDREFKRFAKVSGISGHSRSSKSDRKRPSYECRRGQLRLSSDTRCGREAVSRARELSPRELTIVLDSLERCHRFVVDADAYVAALAVRDAPSHEANRDARALCGTRALFRSSS